MDFIKFSLETLSKTGTKTENDLQSINEIFNDEDLAKFKNELINFVKNYPKNKSQNDLNYEKLINCLSTLRILKDKLEPMINFDKFNCICLYVKYIINQNKSEKINYVCSLIKEEENVINQNFVDSLFKEANKFLNSNSLQNNYSLSTYLVPPANIYPFITINQESCLIKPIRFLLQLNICYIKQYFFSSHPLVMSNIYDWFSIAATLEITPIQFQALIDFLIYKTEKIFGEINQISPEDQEKTVETLLGYPNTGNDLINLAQNFPVENLSQDYICKYALYDFCSKLKGNLDIEFKRNVIKTYFDYILRNEINDEINLAYQLIYKTQDEIKMDMDTVNSLFKMAANFIFLDECLLNFPFTQLKNMKENKNKFDKLFKAINYGFSLQKFYETIDFF